MPLTPLASTRLVARALPGGAVQADGYFSIPGVPPGSYRLGSIAGVTQTSAWVLKSATLGGRDVFDAPFEIGSVASGRLVITLTDRPTELTGVMQDAAGHPAPDLILITHRHGDHFDAETLAALVADGTEIITCADVHAMMPDGLKERAQVLGHDGSI